MCIKMLFKAAVGNFGVNINNFFVLFFWKKCHNIHRQLLVSNVVLEYREISVFSHHAYIHSGLVKILLFLFYLPSQ